MFMYPAEIEVYGDVLPYYSQFHVRCTYLEKDERQWRHLVSWIVVVVGCPSMHSLARSPYVRYAPAVARANPSYAYFPQTIVWQS